MNPAALKVQPAGPEARRHPHPQHRRVQRSSNLERAGYDKSNPLEDGSLAGYRVYPVDIDGSDAQGHRRWSGSTAAARSAARTSSRSASLLDVQPADSSTPAEDRAEVRQEAPSPRPTCKALKAGYLYGETSEIFQTHTASPAAKIAPGTYRNITGQPGHRLGRCSPRPESGLPLFLGSYPITPASDILHQLSKYKNLGVKTFQAEDEIAGDLLGHRRGLRRRSPSPRRRPGHRAQVRGHRASRVMPSSCRSSSSTCSAAARAPACPPRPSRPTCCRRCTAATASRRSRSSPPARRRLLRRRHRGRAHRHEVHGAGAAPVRRLPRQRLRALAAAQARRAAARSRCTSTPRATASSPTPRPRHPRAALGHPRHAGPRAPHRRPREGQRRATSPTTATTTS
jgi:hypothetical protein